MSVLRCSRKLVQKNKQNGESRKRGRLERTPESRNKRIETIHKIFLRNVPLYGDVAISVRNGRFSNLYNRHRLVCTVHRIFNYLSTKLRVCVTSLTLRLQFDDAGYFCLSTALYVALRTLYILCSPSSLSSPKPLTPISLTALVSNNNNNNNNNGLGCHSPRHLRRVTHR